MNNDNLHWGREITPDTFPAGWKAGERPEKPNILAYDADLHSGYAEKPDPVLDGEAREVVEALRLHAFDDCGEKHVPTHIGNIAAALITRLQAEIEAARREGYAKAVEVDHFLRDDFAAMWDDYTEGNWQIVTDPTSFLEQCEDAGLAELVPVDDEALEDCFAAERGIEPGGMMWRLTTKGRERYGVLRNLGGAS